MRIDENGVQHPQMIDDVTKETTEHILNCDECSQTFNTAKIRQYTMSDQFTKAVDTTVEQDLKELEEINAGIAELIKRRSMVMERARNKAGAINERLYASEEWFEGKVRGNPVEDRCVEAPSETRSEFNQRRF